MLSIILLLNLLIWIDPIIGAPPSAQLAIMCTVGWNYKEHLFAFFIREENRCYYIFVWNMCFVFQIDQHIDRYHADKNIYR